jgi:hypothetical protein
MVREEDAVSQGGSAQEMDEVDGSVYEVWYAIEGGASGAAAVQAQPINASRT